MSTTRHEGGNPAERLSRWRLGDGLRSVLFHHIASADGPFTSGLDVSITPEAFEQTIAFLVRHYCPISLDDVLVPTGQRVRRPLLLTFDDAYGSIAREAVPILQRYDIPAVFFINAATVEGDHLPVDNLVCFVANTVGLTGLQDAAARIGYDDPASLGSASDVIGRVVSGLDPARLARFIGVLRDLLSVDPLAEARRQKLFLTADEVATLPLARVEVASHTYHHVWCRHLDNDAAAIEIGHNAERLRSMTGRPVRAFSVPYGSRVDLTPTVAAAVERAGHVATFLAESRSNPSPTDLWAVQRVGLSRSSGVLSAIQLEVTPRLRRLQDRYHR